MRKDRLVILAALVLMFVDKSSAEEYSFDVQPQLEWQNTGVYVEQGTSISFTATGSFSDHHGTHWYPPDGTCAVEPDSSICLAPDGWLLPGISKYSLVCKIGSGPGFFVGSSNSITTQNGGDIHFAINDNYYPDNIGGFTVVYVISEEIPTLTEWGMIIFATLLLGFMAYTVIRRRKRVNVRV